MKSVFFCEVLSLEILSKSTWQRKMSAKSIKKPKSTKIEKLSKANPGKQFRGKLLNFQKEGLDFCFETVMSHPSKIDEINDAKKNGYKIYFYFICIDDPEVNVSRVENRVEKGGHDVSADKIESRYYNTLKNLISAIEESDKCYLFDNSGQEFRLIAKINDKGLLLEAEPDKLPNWFLEHVLKYYLDGA